MLYHHHTEYCFEDCLGEAGVSRKRIEALLERLMPALQALKARKNASAAAILSLPSRQDDVKIIAPLAKKIASRFRHVVVAGAGGSGLSGKALAALRPAAAAPMLHFLETIDPDAIQALLSRIPAEETCFIIISKSGATAETLAHFYVLFEHMKAGVGQEKAAEWFIVITSAGKNPLKDAAEERRVTVLDHDRDIGGRFSVLTIVGLLPAMLAGLDAAALRRGAQAVIAELDGAAGAEGCQPALGAALQYAFIEKGRNISVMLPYSELLSGFSSWYRQSWAESLGKGGKGSTPIRAVGTTDQHSQLQLYLDGPKDKLFHLITVKRAGLGQSIAAPDKKELAYLRGKTTGDIMAAEQKATLETLVKHRCPVRLFALETLAEEQVGALFMHFTLEIIFMAHLLGVNPFDQPAVEEGKRLAREYLLTGNL